MPIVDACYDNVFYCQGRIKKDRLTYTRWFRNFSVTQVNRRSVLYNVWQHLQMHGIGRFECSEIRRHVGSEHFFINWSWAWGSKLLQNVRNYLLSFLVKTLHRSLFSYYFFPCNMLCFWLFKTANYLHIHSVQKYTYSFSSYTFWRSTAIFKE